MGKEEWFDGLTPERLERAFPGLRRGKYKVTSPKNPFYNCIAWSAGEDSRFWWPTKSSDGHWPPGIPRQETAQAFIEAFGTLGYFPCDNSDLESGYLKVALFIGLDGKPTHMCRQLDNGHWTSKLGPQVDISHEKPSDLSGQAYGMVAQFLKKSVGNRNSFHNA